MKDLSNWIKEKNSEYTKIIDEIEYAIKNIKELLEKKKQSDNNLLKLFESMIDTYEVRKKLNNYQIKDYTRDRTALWRFFVLFSFLYEKNLSLSKTVQ